MLRPIESLIAAGLLLSIVLAGCGAAGSPSPPNSTLILATTTSTQDSGLLDVLVPLFKEQSGYTVQTVAVGTGAALAMAEDGNADVLLVHAPAAEESLMAKGYGRDRLRIMHNDFVVVGPASDPAGIRGGRSAAEAFAQIAKAGSPFVSRGDDSGTHKKERSLWSRTACDPDAAELEWYSESGQGMGSTLIIASETGAYTLADRATYLANRENINLEILVEGDPSLLNVYHVITVNPAARPEVNYPGAQAFAEFMTEPATQAIIGEFGVAEYGQPLFIPDAREAETDLPGV